MLRIINLDWIGIDGGDLLIELNINLLNLLILELNALNKNNFCI